MDSILSIQTITSILTQYKYVAVVGLSPKKDRPSYRVAHYLKKAGYTIFPVNPGQLEILGETCYPDLISIPKPVEIVNIFRRSDQVIPYVLDGIRIGAKVIWMQRSIINKEAARIGEKAGLEVIMDRCIKDDHMQFIHK